MMGAAPLACPHLPRTERLRCPFAGHSLPGVAPRVRRELELRPGTVSHRRVAKVLAVREALLRGAAAVSVPRTARCPTGPPSGGLHPPSSCTHTRTHTRARADTHTGTHATLTPHSHAHMHTYFGRLAWGRRARPPAGSAPHGESRGQG